jgi:non-homologous end joining protein Ku
VPEAATRSNVIDLTELLKRSLQGAKGASSGTRNGAAKVRGRAAPATAHAEKRRRAS